MSLAARTKLDRGQEAVAACSPVLLHPLHRASRGGRPRGVREEQRRWPEYPIHRVSDEPDAVQRLVRVSYM